MRYKFHDLNVNTIIHICIRLCNQLEARQKSYCKNSEEEAKAQIKRKRTHNHKAGKLVVLTGVLYAICDERH